MIHAYRFPHAFLALGLGATLALAACGGDTTVTTTATYTQIQASMVALSCTTATCHDSAHVGLTINPAMSAAVNCASVTKYVVANSPSTSQLITVPRDGSFPGPPVMSHTKVTALADGSSTRTTFDAWINAGAPCQ